MKSLLIKHTQLIHFERTMYTGSIVIYPFHCPSLQLYPPGQDHLLYVRKNQRCGFPLDCMKYNRYIKIIINKAFYLEAPAISN